jgi:hypothetical protein
MNENESSIPPVQGSVPPPLPPSDYRYMSASAPPPDPTEQEPLNGFFAIVEAMLRQPRRVMNQFHQSRAASVIGVLFVATVCCSLIYGAVVGSFAGVTDQLWAAPVKIAVGLLICALICLPSLYIFSCLSGSPARLVEVFGLVAGLVALMTVLLLGFAPVAWVFSQSTESVAAMGALHLVFWAIATIFGLRFLDTGLQRHRVRSLAGVRVWMVIFVLVMLQMTTTMRPLVGTADTFMQKEKKFFVTHWKECLNLPAVKPARE